MLFNLRAGRSRALVRQRKLGPGPRGGQSIKSGPPHPEVNSQEIITQVPQMLPLLNTSGVFKSVRSHRSAEQTLSDCVDTFNSVAAQENTDSDLLVDMKEPEMQNTE